VFVEARDRKDSRGEAGTAGKDSFSVSAPAINLPKGGGAIRGIGEKFAANPVTGTGSMSVPIATSPGRGGFRPQLSLSYDSGAGNGLFGLGWNLSLPSITRKTDKGLPRYRDSDESDVFVLAAAEDLVPVLDAAWQLPPFKEYTVYGTQYLVRQYKPRIEGLFALIERWVEKTVPANMFWRVISRDNVTTWYGKSAGSRVMNPDNPAHIFQWNVCEVHDDKGNVTVFQYTRETGLGMGGSRIEEPERKLAQRTANCLPDRIRYGNLKPYLPTYEQTGAVWPGPDDIAGQQWMFEVVFDYSPPDSVEPPSAAPAAPSKWRVRKDPFSTHRAGFEVRTYRLCRRVLMFHHFEELGAADYLVRSTDLEYIQPGDEADPNVAGYTVLNSVTQRAYQMNPQAGTDYVPRPLPPVSFSYSEPKVSVTVKTIAHDQLENLPVGTQGPGYQWIDLDGEGLSGVLAEQLGAWYYKSNLGDCTFGPSRVVARQPAMALAAGSRHQFMDLAGNGSIDVVDFSGSTPGFHERDADEGWKRHVPFASRPNIDWQDPNLRFVDLTGDGHADALITEQEVFTWYPSLDERGFGPSERSRQPQDEDTGPHLVFADGTQTIFLADMCGDGLTDLVRIRNGEVCYWPNLGYGRFGRKVTLGNSPRFDHADMYDPRRIRLADIDGSGPIDIIYLGRSGAQLYFNRSGNSLSNALRINLPIATENLAAVQVADLLGNGTACLVWNSHLPADARNPVRYIDLMAGDEDAAKHKKHEKPHLLIKVKNNLGGTTEIEYTPSTRFYIQDKLVGMPWITRLPFPVHCVSRVTVSDEWRGTQFSNTYSYHHGYFDGAEREFRGFGRVEQVDVENYGIFQQGNIASPWITNDHTLYQPPVKSITWYHTGAALDRQRILGQFAHEYFPQRFADRLPDPTLHPDAFHENPLPEPELPADLSADEWREALRACKGMVLRQEVYELDVDDLAALIPKQTPVRIYSAATHNCHIQRLQRRGVNRHAVFLVTESEALSYQYELALPKGAATLTPDPRIAHTLNLRHDEYGNPQQSVAIGYPRLGTTLPLGLPADFRRDSLIRAVQSDLHVAYSETRYTEDVVLPTRVPPSTNAIRHHRLRLPCEVKTYEISGLAQIPPGGYYDISELRRHALCEDSAYPPIVPPGQAAIALTPLQYHQQPQAAGAHRRIVEHARTLFFDDASDTAPPTAKLAFGHHGPRGLKYEDYKLALTDDLLNAVFKRTDPAGNVDDKLAWVAQPASLGNAAKSCRDLLKDPSMSGYSPGTAIGLSANQYWMRSGIAGFAGDAHAHFFLPERYTDPFDNVTTLEYDPRDLFIMRSEDALGNTSGIWVDPSTLKPRFDYRVLAPIEMVDANGNHSEVVFDIRGLVVAAAIKGKEIAANQWQGDNLSGFDFDLANPSENAIVTFCTSKTLDRKKAGDWLLGASSRFGYHFGDESGQWAQRPAGACAIAREIHAGQPGGAASPLQISLECSDGSGNVMMKKVQAEPDLTLPIAQQKLRWIVNGLTILNNKDKPVKQYEPSFTPDFGCELPQANGVTPIMYYDAAGRVMRTELPDGTLSRVEFSPWHVKTFDANDTVLESDWYTEHSAATASTQDKRAAALAAKHKNTPALTILDSLGREVIAIAHNRTPDSNGVWQDDFYLTYTKLDAEGKPLWIRDARGNLVMQYITPPKPTRLADTPPDPRNPADTTREYLRVGSAPCYDIAGNLLLQHSMDAGDRWMLMDAAGKPMLAWDVNETPQGTATTREERLYSTDYDALHRPTHQWLTINSQPRNLVDYTQYGETLADAKQRNLRGQAHLHYDPSGLGQVERLDFKGKPLEVKRTLTNKYDAPVLDWSVVDRTILLEKETFVQITEYDALGRMTRLYNWHRDVPDNRVAVYVPTYNNRGLLLRETLDVGAKTKPIGHTESGKPLTKAIEEIRYNVKGQKEYLKLGNGTLTEYEYDLKTFRLRQLFTTRSGTSRTYSNRRSNLTDPLVVQELNYTYDPVGNITEIEDQAYKPVFFDNGIVEPRSLYEYDALYRLTSAIGRETAQGGDANRDRHEPAYASGFPITDQTLRRYEETYRYDAVGNFVTLSHAVPSDTASSWTRHYECHPDSNRLRYTWQGSNRAATKIEYLYDAHGNMRNLDRVASQRYLRWDYRDMIANLDLGGGGKAYYNYDTGKQRSRKRIDNQNGLGGYWERIYLGGYELYRRYKAGFADPVEEIESLHLFEGEQRVLLVDDVIIASNANNPRPDGLTIPAQTLFRYQYSNHLGSACLELDDQAEIISYEEYHPYGTSAYRAKNGGVEAPPKRYRYTGMERDEESGLNYHGARYYAAWLGRWMSCDPNEILSRLNLYNYSLNSPCNWIDKDGRQEAPPQLHLIEQFTIDTVATNAGFSLQNLIRQYVQNKATMFFENPANYQAGHHPSTPQWSTSPGDPQRIGPQHWVANNIQAMQEGADRRAAVNAGQYARTARKHTGPTIPNPKPATLPNEVRELATRQMPVVNATPATGRSVSFALTIADPIPGQPVQLDLNLRGPTQSVKPGVSPANSNISLDFENGSAPVRQASAKQVQLDLNFKGPAPNEVPTKPLLRTGGSGLSRMLQPLGPFMLIEGATQNSPHTYSYDTDQADFDYDIGARSEPPHRRDQRLEEEAAAALRRTAAAQALKWSLEAAGGHSGSDR